MELHYREDDEAVLILASTIAAFWIDVRAKLVDSLDGPSAPNDNSMN